MTPSFKAAVNVILDHEGGYVNDPKDPGGETKFGISKRAYPNLNIRDLTRADAIKIYHDDYWQKVRGDKIPFGVALILFDMAVNMGISRSVKFIQKVIGEKQDGIFGDKTMAAIHNHGTPYIAEKLTTERLQYYASLSTFPRFGNGWIRRSIETHTIALIGDGRV